MRKFISATIAMSLCGAFTLSTVSIAKADGYGTAGCGLGSIVFGNKPGIIQVLAATTNGTFGTQTFGITTGTSNCKDSAPSVVSAKAFIQANREAIAKDVARGQGETISSLTTLAGCENDKAVGARLQQDFKEIFPSEKVTDIQVSDSIVSTLQAHPELACKQLG
jgi:Protein of unknown function (DUF3015)